jgi:hypothetical protein
MQLQRKKGRNLSSAYSLSLLIILFFIAANLTACLPATPEPLPTPQIWQAQLPPSLRWLGPALNLCTRQQPGIALSADERPAQALNPAQADFTLRWGAPEPLSSFAAEIATDELVVIVHPDNPLENLDLSEIKAIFTGRTQKWSAFLKGNSDRIQVWTEAPGSDVQQIFQSVLLQQPLTYPFAHLVPDPQAMRQSVGRDSNAIGYIPRRWLDSTVRAVQITGIPASELRQPILVMRETEPQGTQKDWLLCVRNSIK